MSGPVPPQTDHLANGTYLALQRDGMGLTVVRRRSGQWPDRMVRVLRSGICGTDLDILRGVRADAAAVLGHEGIGEVTRADGVTERFVFNPVDPRQQDRILGHGYDGVFQQYLANPTIDVVGALPDLPLDLGPLVEPLGVARYAWRLTCRGGRPETVGVWGGGTAAVLCAIVAQGHGSVVHLFHDRIERLNWLRERGVIGNAVLHWTRGKTRLPELDAAIMCTSRRGARDALSQAVEGVSAGGVVDLYGGFAPGEGHDSLPGVDLAAVRRSNVCGFPVEGSYRTARSRAGKVVRLVGHRGSSGADLVAAQAALCADRELFVRIISHVVSLPQAARMIPELLARTGAGPGEFLKVVIDLRMSHSRRAADVS